MIVHATPRLPTVTRMSRHGSAFDLLEGVDLRTATVYAITAGHASLGDVTRAVMATATGPADVTIATWSADEAEMGVAARALRGAAMRSLTLLVERGFAERKRDRLIHHFPGARLVAAPTHSKYATIRSDGWDVVITTSQNIGRDCQLEWLAIRNDRALAEALAVAEEGEILDGGEKPRSRVSMGTMIYPEQSVRVGKWPTTR